MSFTIHRAVKCAIFLIVTLVIFLSYQTISVHSTTDSPTTTMRLVDNTTAVTVSAPRSWDLYKMPVNKKPCVILYYTKFYRWNWRSETATYTGSFFSPSKDTSCIITSNHKYLPSVNDYDALIFFHWNVKDAQAFPPQVSRRPEQIYILMLIESPQRSQNRSNIGPFSNYFNLTMSYRLDSDIMWPYGRIYDKKRQIQVAPSPDPRWRVLKEDVTFQPNQGLRNKVAKKTKMASWVVSNCVDDPSERMNLVNSLKKFMSVEVYGKCGKECKDCKPKLANDYYFYLAFENTLARDYVSEKTYEVIGTGIIPVVYGGADYDKFLPPHSYINAQDFKTTKELAEFLIALSKDTNRYLSYFWWTDHYELKSNAYADLCFKLKEFMHSNRIQYYSDLARWENENIWVNRTIAFS